MIFETHAHYEDEQFDTDREELLASMKQHGISAIVNVGSSLDTVKKSICLAEKYDFIYAATGIHPSDTDDLDEAGFEWLRKQSTHEKTVAIGEIGLDYYWHKEEEIRKRQREWFYRQLEYASDYERSISNANPRGDSLLFLFCSDR